MTYSLPITNPNPKSGDTRVNIYGYLPWLGLGITAIAIFAICLIAHTGYTILAIRRSKVKASFKGSDEKQVINEKGTSVITFETLFSIGCFLEVLGYAFRTASNSDPYRLAFFILNYFLIVIVGSLLNHDEAKRFADIDNQCKAPVFFSAALYFCLSILLHHTSADMNFLPLSGKAIVRLTLAVFVSADVITIIMQVVGAALVGVSESKLANGQASIITPTQANYILLAGLAVQVFSFTLYLFLLGLFLMRLFKHSRSSDSLPDKPLKNIRTSNLLLAVLVSSSILVYMRTVFRLVESATGVESSAMRSQPLFAGLETVPVLVAAILWTIAPISFFIQPRVIPVP